MKIALDYDDTFTLDIEFWTSFINRSLGKGHDVRIVTARNPIADKIPDEHVECPIIYCDGIAKRFYCHWFAENGNGWNPDIWIDDKPSSIDNNSTASREALDEWRKNR